MPLTETHRKYLVRDQMIGPFIINFLLNAIGPWLAFGKLERIDVWGAQSVVGDLVITMLALPFLICIIATPLVRHFARKGKVPAVAAGDVPAWLFKLPDALFARALVTGLVVCLILSPVIIGFLSVAGWDRVSVSVFALTKGVLCGAMAAVISPPLALRAMAEVSGDKAEQPSPA